jgi:hypothetical protein
VTCAPDVLRSSRSVPQSWAGEGMSAVIWSAVPHPCPYQVPKPPTAARIGRGQICAAGCELSKTNRTSLGASSGCPDR